MKKFVLTSFLSLCLFNISQAQLLERQVVASCGNSATSALVQLDNTVGEAFINTMTSGYFYITQGFMQDTASAPTIVNTPITNKVQYELYPNPAQNNITLSLHLEKPTELSFLILNLEGRIMMNHEQVAVQSTSYTQHFDLSHYPAGNYFLKITAASGDIYTSIPFSKY